MDENKIRQLIRQEIAKSAKADRFGLHNIPNHHHNGNDSPKIRYNDILQNAVTVGNFKMGTQGQVYTINLANDVTPNHVMAYGNFTRDDDSKPKVSGLSVGSAQLTPAFYMQPGEGVFSNLGISDKQYPFPTIQPNGTTPSVPAQSSSFFMGVGVSGSAPTVFAGSSENHILSVFVGDETADIRIRATIIGFSVGKLFVYLPFATEDWSVDMTFVIQ